MPTQNDNVLYGQSTLERGIRSRMLDDINGLRMHILEAGFETPGRPLVLLLHGFPELAYSWRHQLLPLAEAGFHVVAPDQRGYGLTTGADTDFDGDLSQSRLFNLAGDAAALVMALGYQSAYSVVGHDFGSPVAAWSVITRPARFDAVVLMSAPFGGTGNRPDGQRREGANVQRTPAQSRDLGSLSPPRKHYQTWYSTPDANMDMWRAPQGLHRFLRAYYHVKSADWEENNPSRLPDASAASLGRLPRYYVMNEDETMSQTVEALAPWRDDLDDCDWLPAEDLDVYVSQFARTGFQGGLNWYRCVTDPAYGAELRTFAGETIDMPSCFIAGKQDWGVFQAPGQFERMQETACTRMSGAHLIEGAGHWVQQEQPAQTNRLLLDFLAGLRDR